MDKSNLPHWAWCRRLMAKKNSSACQITASVSGKLACDSVFLPGIGRHHELFSRLVRALSPGHDLFLGPSTTRVRADLSGGLAGFFDRRSNKFRQNVRRATRRCREVGIRFEVPSDLDRGWHQAFVQVMEIEGRSWKGRAGRGANETSMREFYRQLLTWQVPAGSVRLIFAFQGAVAVGFILGAVMGDLYRGYQFSFDEDYSHLSLGHALQIKMIELLCDESVKWYDLGTDYPYKRRWGETLMTTDSLVIRCR